MYSERFPASVPVLAVKTGKEVLRAATWIDHTCLRDGLRSSGNECFQIMPSELNEKSRLKSKEGHHPSLGFCVLRSTLDSPKCNHYEEMAGKQRDEPALLVPGIVA